MASLTPPAVTAIDRHIGEWMYALGIGGSMEQALLEQPQLRIRVIDAFLVTQGDVELDRDEAETLFLDWFVTWKAAYPQQTDIEIGRTYRMPDGNNITITYRWHNVGVSREATQVAAQAIGARIDATYSELLFSMKSPIDLTGGARHMPSIQEEGQIKGQASNLETEPFPLKAIRVDFSGGKRQLRAVGGRFTQYGVPLYEEAIKAAKIEKFCKEAQPGDHPVSGEAVAQLKNGKPVRVLSLKLGS